jgi:hypothetical protein
MPGRNVTDHSVASGFDSQRSRRYGTALPSASNAASVS